MNPTEKPMDGSPLPKSVLKWAAAGLVLSSAVVIAITIFSGVTLSDLAKLGYLTFGLAAAVSACRLLVQIARFRVVTTGLSSDTKMDLTGLPITRVASEFVSESTPATSMGVFLRTSWLAGKGVDGGRALWIGYFEVLIEIYVGGGLALIAAAYALSRGSVALGSSIAVIATVLIVGYTLVFVIPAVKTIKVPHRVFGIMSRLIGGPRATALYLRAVVGSLNFSLAARAIVSRRTLPVVVKAVLLTLLEDFLEGAALWLVLNAAGLKIDLVSATLAAYGVAAVAQLPITIGGAGVTELTMQAYLVSVYGFSSWAAVVLWRIATYQVMLAVTGIVFMVYLRKNAHRPSKVEEKVPLEVVPVVSPNARSLGNGQALPSGLDCAEAPAGGLSDDSRNRLSRQT
ncbi:MAG: flippase-like domain-containing protein [Thaumarchaeota archaeon]|nr:flippase-like domain-containing protein [Nitrososphaerota archaeon]